MTQPPGARRSLSELHRRQTPFVFMALIASAVLLAVGLSQQLLYTEKMFWRNSYSVWGGILNLWDQQERALAVIIFFFSIVFPIVKLLALTIIWLMKLSDTRRKRLLHWLDVLGKWSMLDVFVVAILMVLVKLGPLAKVEARSGVYFFAGAIIASMLTTMLVDRAANRTHVTAG